MPVEYDVVVLGAGVAGTAAALAAVQSGARVCVITAAPAATALFCGAWRGPCPDPLRDALRDVGYQLHKSESALPHPAGSLIRCSFSTRAHNSARINGDALVCGIAGLPNFEASALARIWSARSGKSLSALTLTLDTTPRAGWAPASLAALIERNPTVLTQPLRAAVAERGAKAVILPPVIGLTSAEALHARIADEVGCTVGEALGMTPSLPGWRLHNALLRTLSSRNVPMLAGRALASSHGTRRIREVTAGDAVLRARVFVLATGKFAAGGIAGDQVFQESALGCPVWIEHLGAAFNSPDPLILTDPVRTEDQPLLRAGVHANAAHQPVDHDDHIIYENVFVAGSIRSGWNVSTYGIGDCAQDGWRAGTLAVKS